jgi:phosphoribosylaminoimidazole-succinocarboxamide synthase
MVDGHLTLIDEVLTPDSSRYWPTSEYRPGTSPPSFDKQFVRDYLESIGFSKRPPGPVLPDDVVQRTSAKYLEAYRVLTGREFGR